MRELAEQVVTISRSGLTRLVDRIVDAGMLERDTTPATAAATDVILTDKGADLLKRAVALQDALRRVG